MKSRSLNSNNEFSRQLSPFFYDITNNNISIWQTKRSV